MKAVSISEQRDESMLHRRERVALAASFRWAARLNLHEGVANHFSLAVNDQDGTGSGGEQADSQELLITINPI